MEEFKTFRKFEYRNVGRASINSLRSFTVRFQNLRHLKPRQKHAAQFDVVIMTSGFPDEMNSS